MLQGYPFCVFQTLAKSQQLLIESFPSYFASIAINFGLLFGPTEIADTTSDQAFKLRCLIAILSICFAFGPLTSEQYTSKTVRQWFLKSGRRNQSSVCGFGTKY